MKKEWMDVRNTIILDDEGKSDYQVPIKDVKMDFDGGITFSNSIGSVTLNPNDHALGQLSGRVGIPTRYARKCMEQEPLLLSDHFNYWKGQLEKDSEGDREWLLRSKNSGLRAVLSDRYSQLDNNFIFDALGSALDNGGVVDVKNFVISDKHLNLRLVFPSLETNIGTIQNPDNVMVGVHITNSEVGASSLRIDSCLFRLVCSNGMIARVGGDSLMQQRHVHLTRGEMERRVSSAIGDAMKVGDKVLEDFAKSRDIKVDNPLEVLDKLAKKEKYSRDFTDTLKNSFYTEQGNSAFHVVNALTHASQTLPMERRLEVEKTAGDYLQSSIA